MGLVSKSRLWIIVAVVGLLIIIFVGAGLLSNKFGSRHSERAADLNEKIITANLVAVLGWLPATVASWRRRSGRAVVVVGWVVMMGVFLIPHSMFGSQLDWADAPAAASRPNESSP